VRSGSSHDDFETQYWLRTAAAGSWVTILMALAGFAYVAFFAAGDHRLGLGIMLAVVAASGLLALFVVPWRRIVASPWRERAFLFWALLTVAMIWALAMVDGGSESPLRIALFLPLIFASLSFPVRHVVLIWLAALVAFLALAVTGDVSGGYVLVYCAVLAGTATMALWQAKNHDAWRQELARSSHVDPLTQLLNRRGFAIAAERAFTALARHGRPVTLAVIDLDYLKAYNDENGHQAGDDLLCWVGERLASSIRAGDSVARLGGDEFGVLLPDTSLEAARPVLDRVAETLAERAPHCIGVASAPGEGASFDDLYRNADTALYERKLVRPRKSEPSALESS
jgi:diguanylate cyclase (GGDEF)-like protein